MYLYITIILYKMIPRGGPHVSIYCVLHNNQRQRCRLVPESGERCRPPVRPPARPPPDDPIGQCICPMGSTDVYTLLTPI